MPVEENLINTDELTLEEWLEILFNPPENSLFIDYMFPSDTHKEKYIENISERTDNDILRLLRKFLFTSTNFGNNGFLISALKHDQSNNPKLFDKKISMQFFKRLLLSHSNTQVLTWEGVTWILDLLPHFPKQAIETLNSYILAHAQLLPDGRFHGLNDVIQIIRAKFIGLPGTQKDKVIFLQSLKPRDFELFVERLYCNMGYKTQLTKETRDGGKDIIISKKLSTNTEKILIECKKYTKNSIGVSIIRELWATVLRDRVNRGVIVTTTKFTKDAQKLAQQDHYIDLIDGDELVRKANEYLGPKWPLQIDRIITEGLREYQKTLTEINITKK